MECKDASSMERLGQQANWSNDAGRLAVMCGLISSSKYFITSGVNATGR